MDGAGRVEGRRDALKKRVKNIHFPAIIICGISNPIERHSMISRKSVKASLEADLVQVEERLEAIKKVIRRKRVPTEGMERHLGALCLLKAALKDRLAEGDIQG